MKEETIYREALRLFGQRAQEDILIEEMAELTKAVIKLRRKDSFENLTNVLEELVDVEIMINQFKTLYMDKNYLMEKIKEEKLKRLEERIK